MATQYISIKFINFIRHFAQQSISCVKIHYILVADQIQSQHKQSQNP